jgi:hypothetical protein
MDSYSIASVYRSRRDDSFNRRLAAVLSRDPKLSVNTACGITDETLTEPWPNWMRRGLARVTRRGI